MNPSQLERLPLRMEQLYREIGELMMEDVVRRIKKTGKIIIASDACQNPASDTSWCNV